MLLVALEALTRAEEAAAVLKLEGLTVETKKTGTLHAHPMLKIEKESRGLFLRAWQQLNLQWDLPIAGR